MDIDNIQANIQMLFFILGLHTPARCVAPVDDLIQAAKEFTNMTKPYIRAHKISAKTQCLNKATSYG